MTDTTTTSLVATIEAERNALLAKSQGDDEMIALLKRQNELLAMESSEMAARHAEELRKLKQRCDEAVRNETEVTGILNAAAKGIVDGLRRRAGDQTMAGATASTLAARPAPRTLESLQPGFKETVAQALAPGRPALAAPGQEEDEEDAGNLRQILSRLPAPSLKR